MDVRLVFATHNANKAREIQSIMPQGVQILTLDDIGFEDDIPETADTLEENALMKARFIAEKFSLNCFADDTGLEIDALNGEPGVYSARYAGPERDSNANMELVLKQLGDSDQRSARFKTSIALILHGEEHVFDGIVEGQILFSKRGDDGFGYDPIFEPENCGRSFAQMTLEEKNMLSHRARAFEKMIHFLKKDNYTHNL